MILNVYIRKVHINKKILKSIKEVSTLRNQKKRKEKQREEKKFTDKRINE